MSTGACGHSVMEPPAAPALPRGLRRFCVFEVVTSWDLGQEDNPKSARGARIGLRALLGNPH
jgi:hypothetical protein